MVSLDDHIDRALPLLSALHREGISHLAFARLAARQPGLRHMAQVLLRSDDPYARKLAASSLGYLSDVTAADFERVTEAELARAEAGGFMDELNAQSTVEDLVFAAVRLTRKGTNRAVGSAFLARVAGDVASDRRYWNTSHYAMASLLQADPDGNAALFQAWSNRIDGPPFEHESRPSFDQEREWREAIAKGTCDQIFKMQAREEEEAAVAKLHPDDLGLLDALFQALDEFNEVGT